MSKRFRLDCWFGIGKSVFENFCRLIEFYILRDVEFFIFREFYYEY